MRRFLWIDDYINKDGAWRMVGLDAAGSDFHRRDDLHLRV